MEDAVYVLLRSQRPVLPTISDCSLPVVPTLENLSEMKAIVRLKGYRDFYRIRVGDYRIIYVVEETIRIVTVRNVRHRKDVYKL